MNELFLIVMAVIFGLLAIRWVEYLHEPEKVDKKTIRRMLGNRVWIVVWFIVYGVYALAVSGDKVLFFVSVMGIVLFCAVEAKNVCRYMKKYNEWKEGEHGYE